MVHFVRICRNSGTRKDVQTKAPSVVYGESNCIPKLRSQLPFIDKSRIISLQKQFRIGIGQHQILFESAGFIHIEDTGRRLFCSRCLPTPFWPLNQDSTFAPKFLLQNDIRNPFPITIHEILLHYPCKSKPIHIKLCFAFSSSMSQFTTKFPVWLYFDSTFGANSIPYLAMPTTRKGQLSKALFNESAFGGILSIV